MYRSFGQAWSVRRAPASFIVASVSMLLAVSSNANSSTGGDRRLVITPGRIICLQSELKPAEEREISAFIASRAIYRELAKRFGADTTSRILVQQSDNIAWPRSVCDPARGDVVVTISLTINRPQDRYVLSLTARGAGGTLADRIRRPSAERWGAQQPGILPDGDWRRVDWWSLRARRAIIRDATELGSRLADHLQLVRGDSQ